MTIRVAHGSSHGGAAGELQSLVGELHEEYASLTDGHVATYIPELAKVNPDHFGICVVTADGQVFEAGDCVEVEHDPVTHQLRVLGRAPLEDVGGLTGVGHYEVLLRSKEFCATNAEGKS